MNFAGLNKVFIVYTFKKILDMTLEGPSWVDMEWPLRFTPSLLLSSQKEREKKKEEKKKEKDADKGERHNHTKVRLSKVKD